MTFVTFLDLKKKFPTIHKQPYTDYLFSVVDGAVWLDIATSVAINDL